MAEANLKTLYGNLRAANKSFTRSYDEFKSDMQDAGNRERLYKNMPTYFPGFDKSFEEFSSDISMTPAQHQQKTTTPQQPAASQQQQTAPQKPSKQEDDVEDVLAMIQQREQSPKNTARPSDVVTQSKREQPKVKLVDDANTSVSDHAQEKPMEVQRFEREEQEKERDERIEKEMHDQFATKKPESQPVNPLLQGDNGVRAAISSQKGSKVPTVGEMREMMNKTRDEYEQEVYDRRYSLNPDGTPKDSFAKDLFDNWQAGVGEIALTPYKFVEMAENFGIDAENYLRGTNFQHGTGTATSFMNKVLGGDYLRARVEHYRKEGDRYQDGKGITETMFDGAPYRGDFGTAVGKAILSTVQSAPNLVVSIYSGKKGLETLGGAFLGSTAALQKYDEIGDRTDISAADKALAVFGAFVSECVPEIIGAKRYGKMFNQQTVGTVRKETQKEVMGAWEKFLNNDFFKSEPIAAGAELAGQTWNSFMKHFGEGATEALTDVMNLAIDIALGIKDGVTKQDVMSIADSFIVGQLSDAIPSGVHAYQQSSYKHSVKKEIENNPTLLYVAKKNNTNPDEMAEIASKRAYQEPLTEKEQKIFDAYVEGISKHDNASSNMAVLLGEAGLEPSDETVAIYTQAIKETGKTTEEVDNLLKKDSKDMTPQEVAYISKLSEKMKEIAGGEETTQETPAAQPTQEEANQPVREKLSTGAKPLEFDVTLRHESHEAGGKTADVTENVTVSFRSDDYSINDNGAIESGSFTLSVKGKPVYGKRKQELMDAINAKLTTEKTAKDEADAAAREEEERQKSEAYQREQELKQMQEQLNQQKAAVRQSIPMRDGRIDAAKATPEQIVFNAIFANQDGEEVTSPERQQAAVETAKDDILYLQDKKAEVEQKTGIKPSQKKADMAYYDQQIKEYYEAIQKWIGTDATEQLKAALNPVQEAPVVDETPAPETPEPETPAEEPVTEEPTTEEPVTEEGTSDVLRPFDEGVVLAEANSGNRYMLVKESEMKKGWHKVDNPRVVYVGKKREPALVRVKKEKFGKTVPVYLSDGTSTEIPVYDISVKDNDGNFISFEDSDMYSVYKRKTPQSYDEIKNHVIFPNYTFGDLLDMGYEAFYNAVDKETGNGVPFDVMKNIQGAIAKWNDYVAGASQKTKSIAALTHDDLARYRAMQYAILKPDRSAAADSHSLTTLGEIENKITGINLQVTKISTNTTGSVSDEVLKKNTWENPLNRLIVSMELAQKLGYLQENELPGIVLPEELEDEANKDVVTSAELEAMREQYREDKAAGKGLAEYENYPEMERDGMLVSRYRFIMRKKKGGGTSEVNGYDDVKGIYKNIDEAADLSKRSEEVAKEYEAYLGMLDDAYKAYLAGNSKLLAKINKNITTALKAHQKDADYMSKLADLNRRIAKAEAAKYPLLAQSVILHQEIAEINEKIEGINKDVAEEAKNAEKENRPVKRLAVEGMRDTYRDQLAAKTAELNVLNKQNPDLEAAYQEYDKTERPHEGVVIAFPTKEEKNVNYNTWTPADVDEKAINEQIAELTTEHEALQQELSETKERAKKNEIKEKMNAIANQIFSLKKQLVRPQDKLNIKFQTGESVPMSEFSEAEKQSKKARLAFDALVAALQRVKGLNLHMVGSQAEARRMLEMIQGIPELMSVYHGTPAHFDKFDSRYNRTGEGSNAYGWGHYVSTNHDTAELYAKNYTKSKSYFRLDGEEMPLEDIMRKLNLYDSSRTIYIINSARGYGLSVPEYIAKGISELRKGIEEVNSQTNEEIEEQTKGEWSKEGLLHNYEHELNIALFFQKNIGEHNITQEVQPSEILSVEIPDDNGSNYLYWDGIVSPDVLTKLFQFIPEFKADLDKIGIEYNADGIPTNLTGDYVYHKLQDYFADLIVTGQMGFSFADKEASKALRSIGIIGNRVPVAQRQGYTGELGYNYIIFDDNDIEIKGREKVEFFRAKDGTIYGWSIGNDMYLTDEGLNPETPIHEYTHIWLNALKIGNKAAYDKVLRAIKARKGLWEKVTKDPTYSHLTTDEEIASEVLARYSGKRGAKRLMEEACEVIGQDPKAEPNSLTKALINKMQSVLEEFWKEVKGLFGIKSMDDISDWVLKDLFDGKPLDFNTEEMNAIKEKAKADGTFMKAPNGEQSKLTEKQWLQVRTKAFKEWYGDWENPKEGEFFLLDENGEPMVVYHGTDRAGFDIMEPKDYDEATDSYVPSGRGIFMTPQQYVGGVYAGLSDKTEVRESEALIGDDPHRGIYSLFFNIHNPLIVDCSDTEGNPSMWHSIPTGQYKVVGPNMETQYFNSEEEAAEWMYENGWGMNPADDIDEPEIVPDVYTTDQFVELARSQGYDGVIFKNIIDGTDSKLLDNIDDESLYNSAHDVVVALAPNQVKSATQNNGLFSMQDNRIEYQYAEYELTQLDEPEEELIRKQEDKSAETMLDPDLSDQEREGFWENVVTRIADQSNGMRLMLNSINAYRKMKGLEPLDMDKYDVRTKFEACRSIIANKIGFLEIGEQKELDDYIRDFAKTIENSEFYKQHMKEVGGKNPATLTPVQFIERYLMARNNWERAKEGVPRGLAEFKQRMGMGVIEFSNAFTDAYGEQAVLDLWEKIRKMTDFALDTNFEGGMISEELYNELKAKKFYVPQRGFWDDVNPENEQEDKLERRTRGGVTARNKLDSMHKAEGGTSLAEGCLAYIARDARQAIKLSEENKVKKVMFDLLRANEDWCHEPEHGFKVPRQVFYQTNDEGKIVRMDDGPTEEQRKEMRQLKGIIKQLKEEYKKATTDEERADIEAEIRATEEQFPYFDEKDSYRILHTRAKTNKALVGLYVDGVPCEIEMTPRFIKTADALNGRQDKRLVISGIKTITSWLSAQYTMNNPTFFAVNIVRDTPLILTKGAVEYGPEFSARFTGNFAICNRAIWQYLLTGKVEDKKTGNTWFDEKMAATNAQLLDFLNHGGNTGYSNLEELQRWRNRVADLNPGGKPMTVTEQFKDIDSLDKAVEFAGRVLSPFGKALSVAELKPVAQALNEWSEMISRFSAYKSVVDMGLGVNEGIKAAHNLSTNFNRRGLGGPFINLFNTLSVFANATIQGASGYFRTLDEQGGAGAKAKKVAKTAAVMGMLPALLGFICTMFNPDDDEYEYMVGDYTRDNYVILGDVKFALNEQLKPWWCIGVNAAQLMRGRRTMQQACNSVLTSIITNWVPLPQNITAPISMAVENKFGGQQTNAGQIVRQAITPSFMQTLNQWADNKNFMGGKLRYDIGDIPEYQMAPNEAALYQDLAKMVYYWKGGNKLVPSKTKENGELLSKREDINPKEIRANMFWVPSGAMDNFCLLYGLYKDAKEIVRGEHDETNVRVKDIPIVNRFYSPSDNSLYRYAVVREARDIVTRHNNRISNLEKQAVHFSDVYNKTGDEGAKASREEAIRLLTEERKDVVAVKMKKILKKYDKYSIYALQNKLGESRKEVGKYHGESVESLDAAEKKLVQLLLEGVNLKKGLRHSTDVPEWIEWFDNHSIPRQNRREEDNE